MDKNSFIEKVAREAWNWAKERGITDGTNPKDYMTREEGITIIYRLYKLIMDK